jgi:hypothetical protein
MVTGGGTVATGVDGRPSWSPDGFWLVVQSGGGLVLAPVDGSAAPAALPGLEGASDPAFQPSGALSAPPALSLAGVDPDPPVPGQPVQLLGAGFDWIIPSNNRVFWPTADAHTETAVSAATSGSLTTVMPRTVAAGQIRVETRTGSAVLDFVPTLGAIEIRATTREGIGVPGVEAIVFALADGSEVGRGLTDESGDLLLSGLVPGSHRLDLRQPRGFALKGAASQTLDIGVGALVVDVLLTPLVDRISISPERPRMACRREGRDHRTGLRLERKADHGIRSDLLGPRQSPHRRGRLGAERYHRRNLPDGHGGPGAVQRRPQRTGLLVPGDGDLRDLG